MSGGGEREWGSGRCQGEGRGNEGVVGVRGRGEGMREW